VKASSIQHPASSIQHPASSIQHPAIAYNAISFKGLLEKKVTRAEFLLHLGVLFFAVIGISGLLKTLSDPHLTSKKIKPKKSLSVQTGFGSGSYGG